MKAHHYPLGLTIIAVFAVIAGIGEVIVGFTGNYLGILSKSITPSITTSVIGAFYSLGGLFLLTRKRWGAIVGIGFISAEIIGRVYLITVGIAPAHGIDAFKIFVGAVIALSLIIYVLFKWRYFK